MQDKNSTVIQSLCELADILIAGTLIVGLFTLANLGSMPGGIKTFLTARVTLENAILGVAFLLIFHFMFRLFGVYEVAHKSFKQELPRVLAACSIASLFALIFPAMSKTHAFAWPLILYFWVSATAAAVALRILRRVLRRYIRRKPRQVIIVGSGPIALNLFQGIQQKEIREFQIIGFVDSPNAHRVPDEIQCRMLGPIENLGTILMKRVVDHVMIAMPIKSCYDDIQRTIAVCEQAGVESEYVSEPFALSVAHSQYGNLDSHPVLRFKVVEDDYRLAVKRAIDIVGSSLGLLCFSLPMLVVTLMIKLTSRGRVLFVQERYGLNKRRFRMLKFRTMVQDAEARQEALESQNEATGPVFKIKADPRITPFGRFLRKTSLDELPQLFNVLTGDMSLVGPRPLPPRDVSRFDVVRLMRRFSVKPGLTCLWQVSGRSNTTFDEWIALDLKYIDSWSLALDARILARTVPAVIRGHGAA